MNLGLLSLGFVIGMRHALESDHIAAVASLATRSRSVADTLRQGAAWGVGHTLTLFLFGSVVLLLDSAVPERTAQILELLVGIMLVILGADVLLRLLRQRIHIHLHRHADGTLHLHAHSHAGEAEHPEVHHHPHRKTTALPLRALLVGTMHGMAGSAALILLTLQSVHSPLTGLLYIALFGIGSIAGMVMLSLVIAIPLRYSAVALDRLHDSLQAVIGLATVTIGGLVIHGLT
ncbi:MAG TPA: urease accessory protein [Gammaproteobacteria bacterium]|nr:urease accessory protein [Gammaproteobacteria bacterium]